MHSGFLNLETHPSLPDLATVGPAPHRNRVILLEVAGSDLGIALSAWTSTSRNLTREKLARVPALLARLLRDGHHTPFEKSYLRFLILVDDATHIHCLKHRIAVPFNAESARYKELTSDAFYIPADWPEAEQDAYSAHALASFAAYHAALARLKAEGMDAKRAKESARFYLPKGAQLWADISFNWRSLLHFLSLRDTPHAQREVREVAQRMMSLIEASGTYPVTCYLVRRYLRLLSLFHQAVAVLDLWRGADIKSLAVEMEDDIPDAPHFNADTIHTDDAP